MNGRRGIDFFWKLYKCNREKLFRKSLRRFRQLKSECWAYTLAN